MRAITPLCLTWVSALPRPDITTGYCHRYYFYKPALFPICMHEAPHPVCMHDLLVPFVYLTAARCSTCMGDSSFFFHRVGKVCYGTAAGWGYLSVAELRCASFVRCSSMDPKRCRRARAFSMRSLTVGWATAAVQ